MGISNQFHFEWLDEAMAPIRENLRQSLPTRPEVLGIGEQGPSPFINNLLEGVDFSYQACDLFPLSPEVLACDMNDLSPLFGTIHADIATLFRASYFIKDKRVFFEQIKQVLNPGGTLCMDLLIGSSDLPVLDFRFGERRAAISYDEERTAYYQTSFFDERLLREFPEEVEVFCRHARRWPLETKLNYLRQASRFYWRDVRALRQLRPEIMAAAIRAAFPEENIFSLRDFEQAGFEILTFNARYFYPKVKKFNLYCYVAARLRESGKSGS
jgi:hypothetical protein